MERMLKDIQKDWKKRQAEKKRLKYKEKRHEFMRRLIDEAATNFISSDSDRWDDEDKEFEKMLRKEAKKYDVIV